MYYDSLVATRYPFLSNVTTMSVASVAMPNSNPEAGTVLYCYYYCSL